MNEQCLGSESDGTWRDCLPEQENSDEKLPCARTLTEETKQTIRDSLDRLRKGMPGFRDRRSQNIMIGAVARTLGAPKGVLVVEAGTGTGKSLSYLVGALPVAIAAERKLIISTATLALQAQLWRDLPGFLAITGLKGKTALARGRQNFACTRNVLSLAAGDAAGEAQESLDLDHDPGIESSGSRPPDGDELEQLTRLAEGLCDGSWNGDFDAAVPHIPDELRPLITTTSGGCAGERCPHYSNCGYFEARRLVDDADIVVANHALVIADLSILTQEGIGGALLPRPESSFFVIDEGHRLEREAIAASAIELHLTSGQSVLEKARRVMAAGSRLVLEETVAGKSLADALAGVAELALGLKDLQQTISHMCVTPVGDLEPLYRAPMGILPEEWRQRAVSLKQLSGALCGWCYELCRLVNKANITERVREKFMREMGQTREKLRAQHELWIRWAEVDGDDGIPVARWVSVGHDRGLICHASHVCGAQVLGSTLFAVADGIIITSATLSAGGDFSALAEGLGLPKTAEILRLDSPFDLARQAELVVPWFEAMPSDREHPAEVARWLDENLDWTAASLVLFTSRRKMEAVAKLMPTLIRRKIRVQGERAKHILLADHATAVSTGEGSVLFGLQSFGEGIDLPGALCTTVVITQLPFAVPTDPVGATKAEYYETMNRDPFAEISVPDAIRTLTQYAGRLIRTIADEGRIVILDRRMITKSYGSRILRALPPFAQRVERKRPLALPEAPVRLPVVRT